MDYGLAEKTVVVTGAGSGIGLATVRQLLSQGADVAGGDLDPSALEELDREGNVIPVEVDLGSEKGGQTLVETAIERFGGVDALINCAGIGRAREGFLSTPDEEFVRTLNVNFMGVVRSCRAAIPHMVERGEGSIVSVASDVAKMADPNLVDYSASKAAILNFSKALSVEFGPRGIRSNVVSPGPVRTPLWDRPGGFADAVAGMFNLDKEAAIVHFAKEVRRMPLGRVASPDEIASVILFLASDASSFVTGSEYDVNGGTIAVV